MSGDCFRKEEDLHIRILRYAVDNPGFTPTELKDSIKLNDEQMVFISHEVGNDGNFITFVGSNHKGYKYMLSFEGRSRLLEYDELKEARGNARGAFMMALLALIVSSIGVIFEIIQ